MSKVGSLLRLRGHARALALELAAEARAEWAYTSDLLSSAFRTHRELGSADRRLVAETVYGLVRWDRRLTAIIDELLAGRRGPQETVSAVTRDELKLLVYELRQGAEEAGPELHRLLRAQPPLERVVGE